MSIIQILIVVFSLYVLGRTILRYTQGSMSVGELVLWSGLWSAVGVCVLFPQITQVAASILGVGRGADAVLYLSSVSLSYAFYRMYLRIRTMEQEITMLVRKLAVAEAEAASK